MYISYVIIVVKLQHCLRYWLEINLNADHNCSCSLVAANSTGVYIQVLYKLDDEYGAYLTAFCVVLPGGVQSYNNYYIIFKNKSKS